MQIKQFEFYLRKWINLIPKVIEAKNTYVDREYQRLKNQPLKSIEEFGENIVNYLCYLKNECIFRYDNDSEYIFDRYIHIFEITLSDSSNQNKLDKYRNAIGFSLNNMRDLLQDMSISETEYILFYADYGEYI